MEPEGSLTESQAPATCPDPAHILPLKKHFNNILPLPTSLPIILRSRFYTKTMYAHHLALIRATYFAHFNLLDLNNPIIFSGNNGSESFCVIIFLLSVTVQSC